MKFELQSFPILGGFSLVNGVGETRIIKQEHLGDFSSSFFGFGYCKTLKILIK